jgi:hypothetical protein
MLCLSGVAQAFEAYVKMDSFNYAEPTSIRSFLNEFDGDFDGGTQAFAHEWLELGARSDSWELSLLTRYDYDMSFSEDTAELYYLVTNELPLEPGREFRVDLSARHYKTNGLRLGYRFQPDESLGITLGVAYLQGLELTDGDIVGEARAVAQNDYDFNLHADYYYSDDPLFDRVAEEPSGWGYSIDLAADWQPLSRLGLHLQVRDLLGAIFWRRAPHTIADADSDNKAFDEEGYVIFNPTLSGLEEYRDFRQSLHAFGAVDADYQLSSKYALLYRGQFTAETYFSGLGAAYAFDAGQMLAMRVYPELEAFEIEYRGPYGKIRLASDAFTLDRANYFSLSGYLSYVF